MAVAERTNQQKLMIGAFGRTLEAIIHTSPVLRDDQPEAVWSRPKVDVPSPHPIPVSIWIETTIGSLVDLPWERDGWQEGAVATKEEAVSWLLIALAASLGPHSPAPVIGPMWDGGVVAEWHQNGIDIEIAVSPDGNVAWSFAEFETGNEDEVEGHIGGTGDTVEKLKEIQIPKLRGYMRRLTSSGE